MVCPRSPAVPPELGGGHNANLGVHAKKNFRRFTVSAPMVPSRYSNFRDGKHAVTGQFCGAEK